MSFSAPVRPDMLALLYGQHQNYTAELGQTHQKLSKQYKKMSKVERVLSERQDRQMSREERKKWQYSRVLTKRNIADMESQQARLHDMLRQCNNLIASFEHGVYNSPWGGSLSMVASSDFASDQLPPSPFLFTPFSPIAFSTPYMQHRPSGASSAESRPQYWDLSMLSEPQRERRLSSPFDTTGSSADSGYYELGPQHRVGGADDLGITSAADARGQHEVLMSPLAPEFVFTGGGHSENDSTTSITTSGILERDEVPDLISPTAKLGASSHRSHKRCHSENAIILDVDDSHLAAPISCQRGSSVGPASRGERGDH